MPRCCCVPMCKGAVGVHRFPSDRTLRQRWIVAIGRVDSHYKLWMPSPNSAVCHKHFKESDYHETLLGWTVNLYSITVLFVICCFSKFTRCVCDFSSKNCYYFSTDTSSYNTYEGRPKNKLQNGAVPSVRNVGKMRNIRFVGNLILHIWRNFL